MPFVRIDTIAGIYDARKRAAISDVLYEAVMKIGALEHDRFQVFTEHAPESLVFDRAYLGITRGDGFIAIQVTLNEGRSVEQKKLLIAEIAHGLHERIAARKEDVFVSLVEIRKENWSFGMGIAQYAE